MKTLRFFALIFLTSLECISSAASQRPMLAELLDSLDYSLERRATYLRPVLENIHSFSKSIDSLTDNDARARAQMQLGDMYSAIDLDSARQAYTRGIMLISPELFLDSPRKVSGTELALRLKYYSILPIAGVIHEALTSLDNIALDSLSLPEDRRTYFMHATTLLSNVRAVYPEGPLREKYARRAVEYSDSLIHYFPPESLARRLTTAHRLMLNDEKALAAAELAELLPELKEYPAEFAKAAALTAEYYAGRPDKRQEYLYLLAVSALNDVTSGRREVTSLQRLGNELYATGDLERSYQYLSIALSEAINSASQARILESAKGLPLIADSFREHDSKQYRWLMALIVILSVALFVILCMIFVLRRNNRHSEEMRIHLEQLNKSKDAYIQHILSLCSVFFERLEEFNRYVGRKLKANQTKDLYDSIESRSYLNAQTEEFFKTFDSTFNTIHPDFVSKLNALLQKDRRFPAESPGGTKPAMTPELRIAAFMRMGIDDSAVLSKFLGLSLNTIYTYRNRLKNRATDRENFEENLRNLGD